MNPATAPPKPNGGPPQATPSRAGRATEWLLAAVCLFPLVLYPLTRDQGIFAYCGQVIRDGGVPYRDVFEQKGPATHYAYALALTLFGETQLGVRVFLTLVMLVGAGLAAALAGRMAGRAARLPAALCYALAAVRTDGWGAWASGQVEDLMLPLLLGAMLLLLSAGKEGRRGRQLAGGMLLSAACLIKPTAMVSAVAVLAGAAWWWARDCRLLGRTLLRRLGWVAAGLAVPAVAFGAGLAAAGALDDFWTCVVEYNAAAYRRWSEWLTLDALLFLGPRWRVLTLFALWGALGWRQGRPAVWRTLGFLALATWLEVWWQGKYLLYHWTPLVGCLAVAAGCGVARFVQAVGAACRGGAVRRGVVVGGMLVMPWVVSPDGVLGFAGLWRRVGRVVLGQEGLGEFRADFMSGSRRAKVTRAVAEHVRERTEPGDGLLVWGNETLVNFLARRRAPTRFHMAAHLLRGVSPRAPRWREEFLAAVRARPPRYLVVVEGDGGAWCPDSLTQLHQFPAFHEYVRRHYVEERVVDHFHLYRRKPAEPAP